MGGNYLGSPSEVAPSEAHEVIHHLKEAPDLFDLKMDYSAADCAPSRYVAEGSHEPVVDFVKSLTDKPVEMFTHAIQSRLIS